MTITPFPHHAAAIEYAQANDLAYTWEGTAGFEKWRRMLPPGQFFVFPVVTRKGITNIGMCARSAQYRLSHGGGDG